MRKTVFICMIVSAVLILVAAQPFPRQRPRPRRRQFQHPRWQQPQPGSGRQRTGIMGNPGRRANTRTNHRQRPMQRGRNAIQTFDFRPQLFQNGPANRRLYSGANSLTDRHNNNNNLNNNNNNNNGNDILQTVSDPVNAELSNTNVQNAINLARSGVETTGNEKMRQDNTLFSNGNTFRARQGVQQHANRLLSVRSQNMPTRDERNQVSWWNGLQNRANTRPENEFHVYNRGRNVANSINSNSRQSNNQFRLQTGQVYPLQNRQHNSRRQRNHFSNRIYNSAAQRQRWNLPRRQSATIATREFRNLQDHTSFRQPEVTTVMSNFPQNALRIFYSATGNTPLVSMSDSNVVNVRRVPIPASPVTNRSSVVSKLPHSYIEAVSNGEKNDKSIAKVIQRTPVKQIQAIASTPPISDASSIPASTQKPVRSRTQPVATPTHVPAVAVGAKAKPPAPVISRLSGMPLTVDLNVEDNKHTSHTKRFNDLKVSSRTGLNTMRSMNKMSDMISNKEVHSYNFGIRNKSFMGLLDPFMSQSLDTNPFSNSVLVVNKDIPSLKRKASAQKEDITTKTSDLRSGDASSSMQDVVMSEFVPDTHFAETNVWNGQNSEPDRPGITKLSNKFASIMPGAERSPEQATHMIQSMKNINTQDNKTTVLKEFPSHITPLRIESNDNSNIPNNFNSPVRKTKSEEAAMFELGRLVHIATPFQKSDGSMKNLNGEKSSLPGDSNFFRSWGDISQTDNTVFRPLGTFGAGMFGYRSAGNAPPDFDSVLNAVKPPTVGRPAGEPIINRLQGRALDTLNKPQNYNNQGPGHLLVSGIVGAPQTGNAESRDQDNIYQVKHPQQHQGKKTVTGIVGPRQTGYQASNNLIKNSKNMQADIRFGITGDLSSNLKHIVSNTKQEPDLRSIRNRDREIMNSNAELNQLRIDVGATHMVRSIHKDNAPSQLQPIQRNVNYGAKGQEPIANIATNIHPSRPEHSLDMAKQTLFAKHSSPNVFSQHKRAPLNKVKPEQRSGFLEAPTRALTSGDPISGIASVFGRLPLNQAASFPTSFVRQLDSEQNAVDYKNANTFSTPSVAYSGLVSTGGHINGLASARQEINSGNSELRGTEKVPEPSMIDQNDNHAVVDSVPALLLSDSDGIATNPAKDISNTNVHGVLGLDRLRSYKNIAAASPVKSSFQFQLSTPVANRYEPYINPQGIHTNTPIVHDQAHRLVSDKKSQTQRSEEILSLFSGKLLDNVENQIGGGLTNSLSKTQTNQPFSKVEVLPNIGNNIGINGLHDIRTELSPASLTSGKLNTVPFRGLFDTALSPAIYSSGNQNSMMYSSQPALQADTSNLRNFFQQGVQPVSRISGGFNSKIISEPNKATISRGAQNDVHDLKQHVSYRDATDMLISDQPVVSSESLANGKAQSVHTNMYPDTVNAEIQGLLPVSYVIDNAHIALSDGQPLSQLSPLTVSPQHNDQTNLQAISALIDSMPVSALDEVIRQMNLSIDTHATTNKADTSFVDVFPNAFGPSNAAIENSMHQIASDINNLAEKNYTDNKSTEHIPMLQTGNNNANYAWYSINQHDNGSLRGNTYDTAINAPHLARMDLGVAIERELHKQSNVAKETLAMAPVVSSAMEAVPNDTLSLLDDLLSGLQLILVPETTTVTPMTTPTPTTTTTSTPCTSSSLNFKCKGKGMFKSIQTMENWCVSMCKTTGCVENVCECSCQSVKKITDIPKRWVKKTQKVFVGKKKPPHSKIKIKNKNRVKQTLRKPKPKKKNMKNKKKIQKTRNQRVKNGNRNRKLLSNHRREPRWQTPKPKPTTEEPPEIEWEDIVTTTTEMPPTTEDYHWEYTSTTENYYMGHASTISPFEDFKLENVDATEVRAEKKHVAEIPQVAWASEIKSRLAKLAKNAQEKIKQSGWNEDTPTTTTDPYYTTSWYDTTPVPSTAPPTREWNSDWPTRRPVKRRPGSWDTRPADRWRDQPRKSRDGWSRQTPPPYDTWNTNRDRYTPPPTYEPTPSSHHWERRGWGGDRRSRDWNSGNKGRWERGGGDLRHSWGRNRNQEPTEAPDK